jgi:hypothetical protein
MLKDNKSKIMNFGNWIVVAFVFFALFIGTLVTVCVKQDISLVSKNYYSDELVYQDQITRINNTNALLSKPEFNKREGGSIEISFDQQYKIEKGEVKFFCPSNPNADKNFAFMTSNNTQQFDITSFPKGMYKARVYWSMDGKEYYFEEVIYI